MGWVEDMLKNAEKVDKDRFLISKPQLDFWNKIMINAQQTQETNIKLNMQLREMAEYIAKLPNDNYCFETISAGGCLVEKDKYDGVECVQDMKQACIIQYFSEVD